MKLMLTTTMALLMALTGSVRAATTLYVAPSGNDTAGGTREAPFATLERARDEIRHMKKAGGLPQGGVTVEISGGVYELAKPLELTAEDSGTAEAPIVYRARKGETARVLGGKVVTGFKPVTDPAVLEVFEVLEPGARSKVLQADLKAQGITDYGSPVGGGMELFFQAKPMWISRWPNEGFAKIAKMVGEPEKSDRHMTYKVGKWVYEGDRPARWVKEKDPWVHGYWFHDWAEQRHPVKEIDPANRTLEVKPPYHNYGYQNGKWYYAYNLLSEIDAPGEWYLDRETGVLYFYPPAPTRDNTAPGAALQPLPPPWPRLTRYRAMAEGDAIVSLLPKLLTMQDVSFVTVRGLLMEAARGTAIEVSGGENDRIVGCTFRNLGGWAVRVAGGRNHGVVGCDVYETGEGGLALSGGDRKTLLPARHFAENNHIHDYARIQRVYRPGITLSGVGCRASHNLIHNAPHMGMGFGGNDHVIEFNEIHSVCYESNDAGAIYTGRDWTCRGNVIRHNYLHHINGFEGRGCVGVYLDDSFSSADIVGNIFYKVTRAAMIGGGRDNTIENNVFVDCVPAVHVDARGVGWANRYIVPGGGWQMQEKLAALPYQQPPWTKYPHLASILDDDPYLPKYNVVARNLFVGGKWDGIQKEAKPLVTLKDNLFDDECGLARWAEDYCGPVPFLLAPDSPAREVGFQPIPWEQIGVYRDASRASWPVFDIVRPLQTPPPKAARGPAPTVKVAKATAGVTVDGVLKPDEWSGLDESKAMIIGEGIQGEKIDPMSYAWLAHDGQHLYVGMRNLVDPSHPLQTAPQWGQNDAVEIALCNPATKGASIYVLRGYPKGQFESSTEAGAPFEVAQDAQRATEYAARIVSPSEWTCEWRVRLDALGLDPKSPGKTQFNLSARKTAGVQWMMWRGTGGHTWDVEEAGLVEFER
jgi:hypothetical protein